MSKHRKLQSNHPPRQTPSVIFVGSDKGGVGKSFVTSLVADLLEVMGTSPRLIQIDDQERLPNLYPGRVTTIPTTRFDDLRRDPTAIVTTFDPLYDGIEATLADRIPTVIDIGGPQQTVVEEYCALVDLDADLAEAGASALWLVPTTAEPEAMRGAVRTAMTIGRVLPSVKRRIVLNGRDGAFKFYPNSPADRLWKEELHPLIAALGSVTLPAIAPGSWQPFEAAAKRFIDVVGGEITGIQAWTGRSRPAAKVIRGDVAAFLADAQAALNGDLGLTWETSHDD